MEEEYYKTPESVNEYIKLAKGVNGAELIEQLKKYVKKNASILELGSGPGADWEILSKDFNVTGSDFSLEFIKHLSNTFPNNTFLELDAITLTTEQKFEAVYANKVLHHLSDDDLQRSLARQVEILQEGGVVCHILSGRVKALKYSKVCL